MEGMKDYERKHMLENLERLVTQTSCNVTLRSILREKNILGDEDVQELSLNTLTERRKCEILYNKLIQKNNKNTYPVLISALKENRDTGAALILENELKQKLARNPAIRPRIQKYISPPVGLEEFLSQTVSSSSLLKEALVICAVNIDITLEKIQDLNLEGLDEVVLAENFELKSLENKSKDSTQILALKTSTVATFLQKIGNISRKIVLITEESKAGVQKSLQNIPGLDWSKCTQIEEDEIWWSDLTPQFAQEIEGRITLFQNIPYQLKALLKFLGNDDDNLVKMLNGKFLASLILDQSPSLFKNSIPPLFSYYIPRQILSQDRISNEIFKKKLPDIFLFSGLRLHELSTLVGFIETGERTDTSTNQIKERNVRARFMVLLLKDHFEEICKLTSAPVHWLQYENGGLTWVKSRGSMDSLYRLVDEDETQSRLSEDDFVNYLYSDKPVHRSKMPVCIADTPGMGKSSLLASIGRALVSRDPRKLVIFANLTEFVANVKSQVRVTSDLSEEILLNVLSNFLNEHDNELAIFLFQNGLKNGALNIELLLDGYDEVNAQDFELANERLRCLIEKFNSVRIIVSTRPHLLLSLENILQTVGFKIEPFSKPDQIEFLMQFWKAQQQPDKILNPERLEKFGKHCLEIMETKISANDRNIAGIPLLCLLIAETYQKNAVNYSDPDNLVVMGDEDLAPVEVDITCITDLFKHVVEVKFEQYYTRYHLNSSSSDKVELMNAHIVESLRVLFPNNSNIPQKWTQEVSRYPTETLLKVGILEKGSTEQAPRFIHRTFAEYFVSLLAVNNFQEKNEEDENGVDEVTSFIFSVVLSTTEVGHRIYSAYTLEMDLMFGRDPIFVFARTFTFQLAVYFITDQVHSLTAASYKDVSQAKETNDIALACAHDDHVQLFRYLLKSKFFEFQKHILLNTNFLRVTVFKSSAAMVDLLINESDQFENLVSDIPHLLLQTAAKRGVYSVFERLCSSQRFREVVEQNHTDMEGTNLLKVTVENTWEASCQLDEKIEQRIRIVRLLLQINPLLIDAWGVICYSRIHICILLELIKPKYLEKDMLLKGLLKNNILLQRVAGYLTDEQFHMFVQNIPKDILQQMLPAHDESEQKPLRLRLTNCSRPLPTLSLLSDCGVNLLDPGYLESPFTYERSRLSLRTLIQFWGSWHCQRPGSMYSALHHAARERNLDLVQLLLSFGMDVNAPDIKGNTPIFHAVGRVVYRDIRAQFEVLKKLIKNGAELTKLNARNQSLLHVAVQGIEPGTMKFLLDQGLAKLLNDPDSDGNTPLHIAVQGQCAYDIITLLVEWGADVNATNQSNHTPFMGVLDEKPFYPVRLATMALFISKGAGMTKQIATRALELVVCKTDGLGQEEYEQLANKCLEKGGGLDKLDNEGQSLLHHAAYKQCLRGVQFLLSRGLQPNLRDNKGNTPLHLAICSRYLEKRETQFQLAKALVDADSSIVSVCNRDGETALSAVIKSEHNRVLLDSKLLELLQCPPEAARIFMERNIKCAGFDKELANTLIKYGAELNWKTESGTTWLHMAMAGYSTSSDAPRFFVERGIHPDVRDNLGNTPTHHALTSMDNSYIEWVNVVNRFNSLVQLGANVKAVNTKGESLLHLASRQGNLPAVEYLLSMGCDVNAPSGSDGDTVLHYLFRRDWDKTKFYMVELLLKNNTNVNATNKKGEAVAELTIKAFRESRTRWDHKDIVFINRLKFVEAIKLMIDHELDLMRRTTKGGYFLHHISSFLHFSQFHQVVEYVISKGKQEAFRLLDESNQNFVEAAQKHFTVLEETLSLVKFYGLDIQGRKLLCQA